MKKEKQQHKDYEVQVVEDGLASIVGAGFDEDQTQKANYGVTVQHS